MSFVRDAVDVHIGRLLDAHGNEEITYTRGSSSVKLQAAFGKTDFEEPVAGEGDAYVGVSSHDFIVRASDLVLGGRRVEPKRGDTITHGDDVYAVMPGVNPSPSNTNDQHQQMRRIHTVPGKKPNTNNP